MISGLIPHRYAKALYKYALESNTAETVYQEMNAVIDAFRSNPGLEKILANPYVEESDKENLLLAAAGKNPGEDFRRFVKLILAHKREEFAYLMALAYRDIYRTANNISQVNITTAVELPAEEMEKLHKVVENSFKDRKFEYTSNVDPDLIGGFVIDVDSTRMDASVSGELAQLRQTLLSSN